jgi:hypothetical protein
LYKQYFANKPEGYLKFWAMNYFSDALVATENMQRHPIMLVFFLIKPQRKTIGHLQSLPILKK